MQCFVGHGGALLCGGFTPDGKLMVSGAADGTVTGAQITLLVILNSPLDLQVRIWSPKSGATKSAITLSADGAPITCCCVRSDSTLILAGDGAGVGYLASIESGKMLGKLEGHTDGIESVGFCESFPLLVSELSYNGIRCIRYMRYIHSGDSLGRRDPQSVGRLEPPSEALVGAPGTSAVYG